LTGENNISLPDHIVFFDGVCNLCNLSIQYIIRNDPTDIFYFAPLQSEIAKKLIPHHLLGKEYESVILYENGIIYTKSTAALRIAKKLKSFNKLLWAFMLVPRSIRDFVYNIIARNRYKWFGKKNECMIPSPELREKFL